MVSVIHYNVVGIIFSPGSDMINWSTIIWRKGGQWYPWHLACHGTPGSDSIAWHWIHRFLTKVYLEEMERHHFSSCQFPPLFLKTISQGELKKTNLWWISPGISMPCPLPSLTSNYLHSAYAHCIVSIRKVFPQKNSLMLTDRLCTIAITKYSDMYFVWT